MIASDDRARQICAIGVAGTNDRHLDIACVLRRLQPRLAFGLLAAVLPEGVAQRRVFPDQRNTDWFRIGRRRRYEDILAAAAAERPDIPINVLRLKCEKLADDVEILLRDVGIERVIGDVSDHVLDKRRLKSGSGASIVDRDVVPGANRFLHTGEGYLAGSTNVQNPQGHASTGDIAPLTIRAPPSWCESRK